MKVVVVTGCLGFIGSHLTKKCLDMGWRVLGIDKKTYAANLPFLKELENYDNFSFKHIDICDLKSIPDCDYVINTAAETHVGNSILNSKDFLKSNIEGVKNLLELIRNKPTNICKKPILFHFSTDEVYGDIVKGAHREDDLLKPSNPYSASKASGDMLIEAWARTYNIEYVILRPTNNYGIRQHAEKLIPLAIKLLDWNREIRLHNGGTPYRNWLHAEDTAAAVIKIIESGKKNEIFNVAGNFEQQNKETVRKIILHYFGSDDNWTDYIKLDYNRAGQDVRYALDDSKLRSLGWSPKKNFDVEIEKIVKFNKNNSRWFS
jgi:dTDP-glucose 4,6-dehydratase